jgi:hypothetical protein
MSVIEILQQLPAEKFANMIHPLSGLPRRRRDGTEHR